mgnify:CR=1 FL=1
MKDLYAAVTDRIIAALEKGVPPWVCPWQNGSGTPTNLVTGKAYRGINIVMLMVEAMEFHYTDSRWLTFRQASELGVRLRRGEHGTKIVFYRMREINSIRDVSDAGADDTAARRIPLLKSYTVFNVNQLESLPERFALCATPTWQPIDEAEKILSASGASIFHGGNSAFYRPSDDIIQLPPVVCFALADDYYATALHELVHWTSHPRRLNRPLVPRTHIEAYAYEEIVAEMGAAFLCAHCGLPGRLEHATYIDDWLDSLRSDKRLIFVAAGAAQKAADFVLSTAYPVPCADPVTAIVEGEGA